MSRKRIKKKAPKVKDLKSLRKKIKETIKKVDKDLDLEAEAPETLEPESELGDFQDIT